MTNARKRLQINATSIPRLAAHVVLRHDAVRDVHVLLGPERMSTPSETAVAVLQLCDGQRSVTDIARHLAAEYDAPEADIRADIEAMLQELADQSFLAVEGPAS